jgi:hypothetical protein
MSLVGWLGPAGDNDFVFLRITYLGNTNTSMWNIEGWSTDNTQWEPIQSNVADTGSATLGGVKSYFVDGWNNGAIVASTNIGTAGGTANPTSPAINAGGTLLDRASYILNPSSDYVPALSVGSTVMYVRLTFGTATLFNFRPKKRDIMDPADLCFRGDSIVTVLNKETNEEETKEAKNVVKGDLVKSTTRDFVPVLANIVTFNATQYCLLKKDCLGVNLPNHDFYATPGHPIFVNGKEMKASEIPEAEKVTVDAEEVYSFVTEEREYIKINNLDVCTWRPDKWDEYKKKTGIIFREQ